MNKNLIYGTMALLFVLVVCISSAAADDTVTRDLPDSASAGATITVNLTVDVETGAAFYSIDETVPSGWTVTNATDGGDYTSETGHVKWVVTGGAADKTYSYTVDVPADASGAYTFDGIYAFEGMAAEATILGDTTVTVGGAAPTLDTFTVTPTTVEQGGTVDIDIAFSTEVSWAINVNNSTATVETWSGTSTNPTEKHWVTTTGTPTGDYTVDVFMNDVLVDSKTVTVTEAGAANQPPTAVIASPTASGTYHEGTEVSFLSTGSTDPDGTIVSYNWTFGDGNTSTLANTTHIYATADTYTVTLTVTDDDGATNSTTVTVTVSPAIVQINSWTLPSTGTRGTSISATVTIENTGTETTWFVVSISGTQDTTGYPIVSTGTVRLDAGESVDAPVMITVPGSADTESYTLTPVVYKLDDYPAGDPQAIGSGKSVTIS